MRFLIDNALSSRLADLLNVNGHDAVHVRTFNLHDAPDERVFDFARDHNRVLVSADTDFGGILALRQSAKPSLILFRWSELRRPEQQIQILLANLPVIGEELETGSIVVIEEKRIRVRRLPLKA